MIDRVEVPLESCDGNDISIRKAITAGFFYQSARLEKGYYKVSKTKQTVYIHPSSCLVEVMPKCVIYHELVLTSKEFIRNVIEIEQDWLVEVAPHYFRFSDKVPLPGQTAKTVREVV